MDKLLENISNWTVKTIGVMALVGSAWNGSQIGQIINPYFTQIKAPTAIEQVSKKPKDNCRMIDGKKMCEAK